MPIPFSIWIKGVVGTAEFLTDSGLVERVWLNGDRTITSITSFNELYEQLFDDLDSGNYAESHGKSAILSEAQRQAVASFLCAVRDFDDEPFIMNGREDSAAILCSTAWAVIQSSAKAVVASFQAGN